MKMKILERSKKIVAGLIILVLVCAFRCPNQVWATETDQQSETERSWSEMEAYFETMNKYVVRMEDNTLYFDIDNAIEEQESDIILEAGKTFNMFSTAMKADANKAMARISIPIYGKYCGPGHSGPGTPINSVDRACQTHDKCYGNRGYFACSCDNALLTNLAKIIPKLSGKALTAAIAIRIYFGNALCNPFK